MNFNNNESTYGFYQEILNKTSSRSIEAKPSDVKKKTRNSDLDHFFKNNEKRKCIKKQNPKYIKPHFLTDV